MEIKNIKLLICDDHTMLSQAIAGFLKDQSFVEKVFVCTNAKDTIEEFKKDKYDVVILDVNMPEMSGIELSKFLSNEYENLKIIMLSMRSDILTVKECIRNGAHGYLLKNADLTEIIEAIKRVLAGKSYFSKQISESLLDSQYNFSSLKDDIFITPREREILSLVITEKSTKQISEALNISENTVETHRKNLMKKTNTKTTVGLVKYAIERSLF
ncbi:MAG: DNA-binding response regulator [Cytophagales bacterium]|nr:MAG: DNA-binding response regulator [Cytophagales bacterium]